MEPYPELSDSFLTEFYEVRPLGVTESSDDVSPPLRWYLPPMRQILMLLLLCVVALAAIFLMVGCTDGSSQAGQEGHAPHSENVKLALRPEHDSGVSGTASFEEISEGVLVKLKLRGLPKPNALYLAHIHPGTCAQGAEGEPHKHGEHAEKGHEHGGGIEYPLSRVKSDSEGHGSSTTTLRETSLDKLFSGEPKHVNVHEAGSGNPPILSCADLKRAG
jgi:hypothetical protein